METKLIKKINKLPKDIVKHISKMIIVKKPIKMKVYQLLFYKHNNEYTIEIPNTADEFDHHNEYANNKVFLKCEEWTSFKNVITNEIINHALHEDNPSDAWLYIHGKQIIKSRMLFFMSSEEEIPIYIEDVSTEIERLKSYFDMYYY